MPNYQYSDIEEEVKGIIGKRLDNLNDSRVTINRGVRFVLGEVDLRSTKRKSTLSPNLFDDIYDYNWPTDGKDNQVIDVIPQVNRSVNFDFIKVANEEFDRKKHLMNNHLIKQMIAFSQDGFTKKIRISANVDDNTLVVSSLDDTDSGGGTWSAFGDAENLEQDSDNYVKGSSSIKWGIDDSGGTTAGIENTGLDTFDLTDYVDAGSVFVWAYIQSTTNLTNFILKIGNDSTNNLEKTVTTTHEGTSFVTGWNLLRFDLSSATENGTLDPDDCSFARVYMTKDAAKTDETEYRFDHIMVKKGEIHELYYYSKYGWQNTSGTWILDSTADTDYLNAESDELQLILTGCEYVALKELNKRQEAELALKEFQRKKSNYLLNNPSEALLLTQTYHEF
jgi:hypothetical protein